jgi:hypothetical protein
MGRRIMSTYGLIKTPANHLTVKNHQSPHGNLIKNSGFPGECQRLLHKIQVCHRQ